MTKWNKLKDFIEKLPDTDLCIRANPKIKNKYKNVSYKGHVTGISLSIYCINNNKTPCDLRGYRTFRTCNESNCINPKHYEVKPYITEEEVILMRRKRNEGVSNKEIARIFDVSEKHAYEIITKKKYPDIV